MSDGLTTAAEAREALDELCYACAERPGIERVLAALDENERLREALKFYAERRNYRQPSPPTTDTPLGGWLEVTDSYDGKGAGARAREALSNEAGR